MIRNLRRRHGRMWLFSSILLLAIFWLGFTKRSAIPPMAELPASLAEPAPTGANTVFDNPNLWTPLSIETKILQTGTDPVGIDPVGTDPAAWWLSLKPKADLQRPDILVYWSPTGKLSEGILLGRLSGTSARTFSLPARALAEPGSLMLHSLGHGETFAEAKLDLSGIGGKGRQP